MQQLIVSRSAELNHYVSVRRNQGFAAVSELILKGKGIETLDALHSRANDMQAIENRLLEKRQESTIGRAARWPRRGLQ